MITVHFNIFNTFYFLVVIKKIICEHLVLLWFKNNQGSLLTQLFN